MIVGYARTSTTDQAAGLERDLTAAGAERISAARERGENSPVR